jgi:glycosyltransferase involved in cell wall biosynthesis
MTQPLVTVIIPAFNYARYIEQCISSVLQQTYPRIETIVVDDGSTDNTADVIKKFGDKIRIVRQANSGVSVARNTGLLNSSGEYVAFLDADDWWEPIKVETQIAKMLIMQAGISYGFYYSEHDSGKTMEFTFPQVNELVKNQYLRSPLTSLIPLPCSNAIIKREIIGNNLFNTKLSNSADWEYFARISRGVLVVCVPVALTHYRIHPNSMSRRKLRSYYFHACLSFFAFLRHIGILKLDFFDTALGLFSLIKSMLKDLLKYILCSLKSPDIQDHNERENI